MSVSANDLRGTIGSRLRASLGTMRFRPFDKRVFRRSSTASLLNAGLLKTHAAQLPRWRAHIQTGVLIVVVAFAYYGTAKLGLSLASSTKQVTAIWPPTGLALTALLLLGYRVWPGILLGAFLANATLDETLVTAASIAAGNTLAGILGAILLQRLKFHATLDRTRDVCSLVFVALVSTIVSSALGTVNLIVGKLIDPPTFSSVWGLWWIGDTLGILLAAPFLLTWLRGPRFQWRDWKLAEYASLFLIVPIASYFAFASSQVAGHPHSSVVYSAFPFLIWAALRFGQREVVTSALIVSSIAIWGTMHDRGPFAFGTLDERLIALDTFAGITVITALLLGAVTAERRQSQLRLRRARSELETRVSLRTAELEFANEELYELSYSMSHDLRAPLRAVNAFSHLLMTKNLEKFDAEEKHYLDGIAKNSRQMGQMLESYLHLLRLRNEPLKIKSVDMNALTQEMIASLSARTGDNKPKFEVGALPPANGDQSLIREILFNLLSNAIKFTRERERPVIEIGGSVTGDEALYYVKDNGIGFDMQWADQLFKVFQRLHVRDYEGTGIGLATVARIVQRHGGWVHAEGSVDNGATFCFTLPHDQAA